MVPLLKLTRFTGPAREVLALAERDALALSRLGVERSAVFDPVAERVRRSPADEREPRV